MPSSRPVRHTVNTRYKVHSLNFCPRILTPRLPYTHTHTHTSVYLSSSLPPSPPLGSIWDAIPVIIKPKPFIQASFGAAANEIKLVGDKTRLGCNANSDQYVDKRGYSSKCTNSY